MALGRRLCIGRCHRSSSACQPGSPRRLAHTYPVWYRGAWRPPTDASPSIFDAGFLRGFGIFDYLRIVDGRPVFLADHLARFLRSADRMGLRHSYSEGVLAELVGELAARAAQRDDPCLGVRLVLSGGESTTGFEPAGLAELFVLAAPFAFADPNRGLSLISREYARDMPDIKSLNYAFALRSWPAVRAAGADDLLYYTHEHGVSESSRSNLFYVKDGALFTPASLLLEGITRGRVLALAAGPAGLDVRMQRCSLDDFLGADEVFTTGTTKRVAPVTAIDGRPVGRHAASGGSAAGPVTRRLYELLVASEAA